MHRSNTLLGKHFQELSFWLHSRLQGGVGSLCHGAAATWMSLCSTVSQIKSISVSSPGPMSPLLALPRSFLCLCGCQATFSPAPQVAHSMLTFLRGNSLYFSCQAQVHFSIRQQKNAMRTFAHYSM